MILTLRELAEHLKVNERTILRMIQTGQIGGTKIGGQWRFNGKEIDEIFFGDSSAKKDAVPLNELSQSQIGIPVSRTMDPSRIIMDLRSSTVEGIIEELTAPRMFNDLVLGTRDLQEKCLTRERLCSTAVNDGVAVPHPRDPIATLRVPGCIVYGYSKKGVDFGAADGKPVHYFFLICSQNIDLHLHLMGAMANILRQADFIKQCKAAKQPEDIIKAVMECERAAFLRKDGEN